MLYVFTEKAFKDLQKLQPQVQKRILKKLDYFSSFEDPLRFSEPLFNNILGQYRIRIGDFRVIFDCQGGRLVILRIGHRKSIYK